MPHCYFSHISNLAAKCSFNGNLEFENPDVYFKNFKLIVNIS